MAVISLKFDMCNHSDWLVSQLEKNKVGRESEKKRDRERLLIHQVEFQNRGCGVLLHQ